MERMDLQERLEQFVDEADIPGAVLGVLADDEVRSHAAGVLNRRTGVEVTTDSVFQIGSNTKVWTATQVMQLVDEGRVDLDAPVRRYLPDFTTREEGVTAGLTVRHLLTHTGGVEGDVFDDVGSNDDAIERYVAALSEQGSVHELGETWSYCNSGYVVAGRLVEVLRGKPWAAALKETIAQPLGIDALCVNADEAILHRAAVGHVKPPDRNALVLTPRWSLPQGIGPAGLITTTVTDLLRFARMHLSDGAAPDGTPVLSPERVKDMQSPQVDCPAAELATHWGLGWMINVVDGRQAIGHGGNTIGQSAYFWAVPDRRVAVALLTNAGGRHEPSDDLVRELLADFADLRFPPRAEPSGGPVLGDLSRFAGRYERHGMATSVELAGGQLQATMEMSGPLAESMGLDEPITFTLHAVSGDESLFVAIILQFDPGWMPLRFYGVDGSGRPRFLHTGGRASRRTG